jgi:uncharacterized membrane protein (UPF0127 family)
MRALHRNSNTTHGRLLCLVALSAFAGGCDRQVEEGPWTSPIPFDTAVAWVHTETDSTQLLVELARTDDQHQFGLMTRPSLDPESGMVFLYDSLQTGDNGFWMFRTKVPLDIAFLDRGNMILTILQMEPCLSTNPQLCRVYAPGVDYWAALEVNRGWFTRHAVGVGGRVVFDEAVEPEAPPSGS